MRGSLMDACAICEIGREQRRRRTLQRGRSCASAGIILIKPNHKSLTLDLKWSVGLPRATTSEEVSVCILRRGSLFFRRPASRSSDGEEAN